MERLKASDFDPDVLILFDAYVHGALDRRGFLHKASKYAVGGMTAAVMLDALNPKFAEAQQVAKDDARIKAEYVPFPSPQGNSGMKGYLVRPANAKGKLPGVLVVHENRGLNPHIEDIARRLALDNFLAFAPDALAPLGGYPGDEDKARELFPKLDQAKTREDFVAAHGFLKGQADWTGKVGVVGFCYGGGIANMLAVRLPDLAAAVPFYGNQPSADGGREDQGAAAGPLRGDRPADQRRVAGVRGSAQGEQGALHDAHVPGHAARLQQRHHAALRREGGEAGVAAHARVLQQVPARVGRGPHAALHQVETAIGMADAVEDCVALPGRLTVPGGASRLLRQEGEQA